MIRYYLSSNNETCYNNFSLYFSQTKRAFNKQPDLTGLQIATSKHPHRIGTSSSIVVCSIFRADAAGAGAETWWVSSAQCGGFLLRRAAVL